MWKTISKTRFETQTDYEIFQHDLFQHGVFINRTILALNKIIDFNTETSNFKRAIKILDVNTRAILNHQTINLQIYSKITDRLPEEDPLLLKDRISRMSVQLTELNNFVSQFNQRILLSQSTDEIERLLRENKSNLNSLLALMNEGLNLHSQVESSFFQTLRNNNSRTIDKLNQSTILLFILLICIFFFAFIYLIEQRKNKQLLKEANENLEATVDQRTNELFIANKELKRSEKRYRIVSDTVSDWAYSFSVDSTGAVSLDWVTDAFKKVTGYDPKHFLTPEHWIEIVHPDDLEIVESRIKKLYKECKNSTDEYRLKCKDGTWIWIRDYALPIKNKKSDKIENVYGAAQIITERKKFENDLKFKNAAIENSLNGFDIVNEEGKLVYVNKSFVQMYGYDSAAELIGTSPVDLCEDPKLPEKVVTTLKEQGEYTFEHIAKRKDGTTFEILMYARLAHDENGNEFYPTTSIDITDQKKARIEKELLQKKLIQSQKMESIGKLAGGIAHDFNNILYPIIGFTQLSMDDLPKDHPVQENLQDVLAGSKRARDLVKRILLFSRQQEQQLKPFLLKPIIEETIKLLRSTIPANIEIKTNFQEDDFILCDKTEINEIVMNLCTNAYQSIENLKGVINVNLEKRNPSHHVDISPGNYLCLSVIDNGMGIPEENLDKIFEPYFTSKGIGKGSGLGLSVVHGIVNNYNGAIQVDTKLNQGTHFDIFFPITGKPETKKEDEILVNPLAGTEKILFVDDEKSIVKLGVRSLERLGYDVTGICNSNEALTLFKSDPFNFDLVITDMAMPEIIGTEMAKQMLEIRNDIPIILCSGYSDKLSSAIIEGLNIQSYIDKPIQMNDLIAEVRHILDQPKKGK